MSIYGKTKGTENEKMIGQLATAEAMGGMMYYALSRIAKEMGLDEVAEQFFDLGNQETNHAGFYATLNGRYPNDADAFWRLVRGLSKAECKGEGALNGLADKLEAMGIVEAADQVREFALQEKHHGEVTSAILKKFAPKEDASAEKKKIYVCPVCGFEYEGELDQEPDDWKCPICSVPKKSFKQAE